MRRHWEREREILCLNIQYYGFNDQSILWNYWIKFIPLITGIVWVAEIKECCISIIGLSFSLFSYKNYNFRKNRIDKINKKKLPLAIGLFEVAPVIIELNFFSI